MLRLKSHNNIDLISFYSKTCCNFFNWWEELKPMKSVGFKVLKWDGQVNPCYVPIIKCGQHMGECIQVCVFQLSTIFELSLCWQILVIDNTNSETCNKSWIVQILCRNVERTSRRKWHLLCHVGFCLFLSVLLKNMKVEKFCLMITAKHFVQFFLCWLYKETESTSTEYNASDIDLLLSWHILVILNKLFFQM